MVFLLSAFRFLALNAHVAPLPSVSFLRMVLFCSVYCGECTHVASSSRRVFDLTQARQKNFNNIFYTYSSPTEYVGVLSDWAFTDGTFTT